MKSWMIFRRKDITKMDWWIITGLLAGCCAVSGPLIMHYSNQALKFARRYKRAFDFICEKGLYNEYGDYVHERLKNEKA
jgi:hypothetical protein